MCVYARENVYDGKKNKSRLFKIRMEYYKNLSIKMLN